MQKACVFQTVVVYRHVKMGKKFSYIKILKFNVFLFSFNIHTDVVILQSLYD